MQSSIIDLGYLLNMDADTLWIVLFVGSGEYTPDTSCKLTDILSHMLSTI